MTPNENRNGTLVGQVMGHVRQQINSRQIATGARLPSIRKLAQALAVSKSTVVEAYGHLVAEGAVLSRPGSGFYACGLAAPLTLAAPMTTGGDIAANARDIDPVWMTRQSLSDDTGALKPGCGWLPASWMPRDDIGKALRGLARAGQPSLTDYASPLGLPALRHLLSHRLAQSNIAASPSQIMLCESGTQAVDLLCRFLLKPGDTVLLDDPCYFNFHALLRAHRVNVISVPYTPTGPDLQRFGQVLSVHRPRLYITNSALHNPTGVSLSQSVAHKVLNLAQAHELLIVEDDIFADFEQEPSQRLAALDGLDRVIHIGSFSKTLSASVRCGFIAVRGDWIDGLVDLKLATAFGGGAFGAEMALWLLKNGAYRRHLNGLRIKLTDARGKVAGDLRGLGIEPWIEPAAGMFLWCRLPNGLLAADVARHALRGGLMLAPGDVFSLGDAGKAFLRFNAAQSVDPAMLVQLESAMLKAVAVP